ILGPSGCGKTTLLRIIAGLETPDRGRVFLQGREATDLPVQQRRVGFVFQHYALFRHMTVYDNVAFGLSVRPRRERPPRAAIRAKVEELLGLVQLDWAAGRRPQQLSGGQRQRVALARALAVEPQVLLLDEPFGALDTQVRRELRRWLRRLHDALHFTSLFVTHDQQEALEVADAVIVMQRGRIEQRGSPAEIYDEPRSGFVHRFVGASNELPAERRGGSLHVGPLPAVPSDGPDARLAVVVRPQDVLLSRSGAGWPGRVTGVRVVGPLVHVELALDGAGPDPVVAEIERERFRSEAYAPGDAVVVRFARYGVYPPEGAG
ncbi:MAG: sulfate/molybdate ABC transporter ATP-binding protein, partial [Proteobacteria bacterium]|nr:sulfate/molybdate ABC transporter ATP-binding protein [Pseudomonadota bacterium]